MRLLFWQYKKNIAQPGFYRLSYLKVSDSSTSFTRINVIVQLIREFSPNVWIVQIVNDFGRKESRIFTARIVNQVGGQPFLRFYGNGDTPLTHIGHWPGRGNEYGVIQPLTMVAPTLRRSRREYEGGGSNFRFTRRRLDDYDKEDDAEDEEEGEDGMN